MSLSLRIVSVLNIERNVFSEDVHTFYMYLCIYIRAKKKAFVWEKLQKSPLYTGAKRKIKLKLQRSVAVYFIFYAKKRITTRVHTLCILCLRFCNVKKTYWEMWN